MVETRLSQKDIQELLEDPTPTKKASVVEKISEHYNTEALSDQEVKLAEDIFRLLLRETETMVRQALSKNLIANKEAPRDIILSLARDVEEVALPVLEFSEVLTDQDLMDIIRTSEEASRHLAIAGRKKVSEKVSEALIDRTIHDDVIGHLLQNEGAIINETNFSKVLDKFADNERIVDAMITRGALPQRIIERMADKVAESIQKHLEEKYKTSFKDINTVFQESSEIAALKFMGMQEIDDELVALVDDLEAANQLEKSLASGYGVLSQLLDGLEQFGGLTPISALACGNLTLFCTSLSRMTGVSYTNVRKLVQDREGGLKALYERAKLPPKFSEAVYLVVGIILDMEEEHAKNKAAPRARDDLGKMVNNIMNQTKDRKVPNLAHFLSIIQNRIEAKQGEW